MAGAAAPGPSSGTSPQEEAFDGLLGGGALTRRPGCLTPDGTRLALCCGHVVRLYSTATGLPHLELRGHRGEVTAVAVRPQPPPDSTSGRPPSGGEGAASVHEVVTTSLDGTVRVWTLVSGAAGGGGLLGEVQQRCRVVQAPGKVESVALPPAPSPLAFLSIRKEASDDAGAGRVVCINLISGKVLGDSLAKTAAPCMLVCSAAGGVLATWEKHTATLWSVANVTRAAGTSAAAAAAGRIPQPLRLRHTKALTCVSVDPGERRLAAGDVTGRVLIWHGIHTAVAAMGHDGAAAATGAAGSGAHIQVTTLHWHAGPVACVSWSPDGTRLLSGGGESVLVLWRPEEGTKTFLPRLGGPLSWLAHCDVDAAQLALGCGDNAAHVVNLATMKVSTTVRGAAPALLMVPPPQPAAVVFEHPCGPVWDARTGCVVLPAAGGALQWYDMAKDAGAGYVHITEAGRQPSLAPPPPTDGGATSGGSSKAALHRRPVEPHVCGASLGPGGGVLVSVDRIGEGSSGDDLTRVTDTLRFWRLADAGDGAAGATSPVYVLTTRVDAPHGGATLTAVHHAPVPGWVVTTSAGGCDFRLWTCGSTSATSATWRCRSVGFYQKRPMTCAAFSPDASLLAVGARDAVTVWEPRSNALVAVLYPVPPAPAVAPCAIEFLAFLSPQQQDAAERPAATSPMLCAVWDNEHHQQGAAAMPSGGGICVYDLLSLQAVRRHAPLGGRVLSCGTDAGATSVAVLMQPAPRPQAQAQSPAPPLVLLFSGPSTALTAAWALRSDAPSVTGTRLVFVPRAAVARHSALGGANNTSAAALDGSCLVVVTSDRRFILAPLPQDDALLAQAGAAGEPAALAWGGARTPDAKAPRDGLGDAFGSLRVTPGDARPLFTGASPAGGGAGAEWVSPLADVPSHALPPLTAILPLYLDALLKASEPATST